MVDEAVDHGGGHGVVEDLAHPGLVGRDDGAGPLVAAGRKLEEQVGGLARERGMCPTSSTYGDVHMDRGCCGTGQATVRARTPAARTWATGPPSRRVTRCPASGKRSLTNRPT
jgi:hypothetical protein